MTMNRVQFHTERLLLIGATLCTLLVMTGTPALAHGDDLPELSAPHTIASNSPPLSSPEAARRQAACWALTVPYGAAKMVYSIGGGLVGGVAWAVTGGNMEVAKSIWIPSMTGDYIIQPQHLTGEKRLHFVGIASESPHS